MAVESQVYRATRHCTIKYGGKACVIDKDQVKAAYDAGGAAPHERRVAALKYIRGRIAADISPEFATGKVLAVSYDPETFVPFVSLASV